MIDDSVIESVDCNRDDECDAVGNANQNDEGTSIPNEPVTHDISSCQQVTEAQWSDESLTGCFKLAKAGKGVMRSMIICYITKNSGWRIIPSVSCSEGTS